MRVVQILLMILVCTKALYAQVLETGAGLVSVTPMITGLDTPWAIAHLPNGNYLVTERGGALIHIQEGRTQKVSGVPKVWAKGQGGLLDVMIPRDFDQSRAVFLSYSKPMAKGGGTALAVGRLSPDGAKLTGVREVFQMSAGARGGRHFGSRIVEARDGTLFLTIGERGDREGAQDLNTHNGTVVRIRRDGTIPADNPFVNVAGVQPEIYSYGHRNPQGAALDLRGTLWVSEHGASGGDEVNRIKKGANYGWPVISYGRHYTGFKIGEGVAKKGMEQPVHYWDPSIAPSGLMIYSGKLWPEWRGDLFAGSLKFDYISRLDGKSVNEVEQIKSDETNRVRDIVEAPDGSIWFISVGNGTVYRLAPVE